MLPASAAQPRGSAEGQLRITAAYSAAYDSCASHAAFVSVIESEPSEESVEVVH